MNRVAGPDRYATAAAISSVFFGASQSIYLATGTNYPDALAAVPGAGRAGSPLLLVRGSVVPAPVTAELMRDLATAHLDRRRHGRHRRRRPAVHQLPARKAVRRTAVAIGRPPGRGDGRVHGPGSRSDQPRANPDDEPDRDRVPARHAGADAERGAGAIGHRAPGRGDTLRRGDDHDRHARFAPAGRRARPARDGTDRRGSGGRRGDVRRPALDHDGGERVVRDGFVHARARRDAAGQPRGRRLDLRRPARRRNGRGDHGGAARPAERAAAGTRRPGSLAPPGCAPGGPPADERQVAPPAGRRSSSPSPTAATARRGPAASTSRSTP